jgi:hypothetical protein
MMLLSESEAVVIEKLGDSRRNHREACHFTKGFYFYVGINTKRYPALSPSFLLILHNGAL